MATLQKTFGGQWTKSLLYGRRHWLPSPNSAVPNRYLPLWLPRGCRPPLDSRWPLKFHRRDARNGPERLETVGLDGAGKDTDPGQGRVRPKPESVAGVSHLAQSFEGIVSDGNGHADLHGVRQGARMSPAPTSRAERVRACAFTR